MTITPPEQKLKKVKVAVTSNPVETSFEKWAKPGHFSRLLSKGPNSTTWIWNLHADAHDFDSHTTDLEDISSLESRVSIIICSYKRTKDLLSLSLSKGF